MSNRVNPNLMKDLRKFGVSDWNACFHCGNCTAICPLSEDHFLFPRKSVRYLQMGLEDRVKENLDPWLCYYCADCTEDCPRDANPGEVMMSLRRYLTAAYDWTGLSRKFYTSKVWEIGAIAVIAAVVVFLFLTFLPFSADPSGLINADGGVKINSFVQGMESETFVTVIEYGDWTMAAIVSFFLLSNIFNMYRLTILKDKKLKIPLKLYVKEAWNLIFHFATQIKLSKCEDKAFWGFHWLIMSAYTIMFTMIVVYLPWFQTEKIYPVTHPQRFLGYYATFGLLLAIIIWSVKRITRKDEKQKFSHVSDWLFLIMLFLTTLTGIMLHYFRISGYVRLTYYTFIVHLAVLVPMLMVEVPFSKWSHLAYRPFAVYFANLKKSALKLQRQR